MKDLDDSSYARFCGLQNLNQSLNTLRGIIDGANIDGSVSEKEISEIRNWCDENASYRKINPFNELLPMLERALEDGILDEEEIKDLQWFLDKACGENPFYNSLTAELQYLAGLLHGILSDGIVSEAEVFQLSEWMESHEHLAGCYPFDELYSVLTDITRDHIITPNETEFLKAYFAEFVTLSTNNQIAVSRELKEKVSILGVCAVTPEISFKNSVFTFTGFSIKGSRKHFAEQIESRGGVFKNNVTNEIDYLVYGSGGNPCWAYSCYGRKVETVANMRKTGSKALIIHENDFWDAYEDML